MRRKAIVDAGKFSMYFRADSNLSIEKIVRQETTKHE